MSFPTDLSIDDLTPTTFTYSQISLENSKSVRRDSNRDLATPRTLVISHTASGKGLDTVDRHLIRFNDVKEDADAVTVRSGSVYMVIEKPQRIVSDADIESMVEQMAAFLTAANLIKILNGEP